MVALCIALFVLIALTSLVVVGLKPFWHARKAPDVQHLTLGVTWFISAGAATGLWGAILVSTSLTMPVMVVPGLPVSALLVCAAIYALIHLLWFIYETLPDEAKPAYTWLTAPFYPRRVDCLFPEAVRQWWRRRSE